MKARHKDTGEIIELAEEGITSRDGRHFCWYQVELIPEPIDECKPQLPIYSYIDANVEYIRKDALLEWAKECFRLQDSGSWYSKGAADAFSKVIEKIESL